MHRCVACCSAIGILPRCEVVDGLGNYHSIFISASHDPFGELFPSAKPVRLGITLVVNAFV